MKLYVCNRNNRKEYIDLVAPTRRHLAAIIGNPKFFLDDISYTVNDVYAESDNNDTVSGVILGGLVGLLGGPVGLIIGGATGALIGNNREDDDQIRVSKFNRSYL